MSACKSEEIYRLLREIYEDLRACNRKPIEYDDEHVHQLYTVVSQSKDLREQIELLGLEPIDLGVLGQR